MSARLTVQETADFLRTLDGVLILTHVRPDGDTVGCAAALCRALRQLGKRAFAAQLGILSVLLGGISNQWDRLRRGSVTDYLQFPHRKAKKRALVWNLADFMLIGGVVLTVAGLVKELIKK